MHRRKFKAPSGAVIGFTDLGFGTAPIGNLFQPIDPEAAQKTLEAAWSLGIRYFDTAPLYGLGLAETRLNRFLHGRTRSDYVLSTKVGRLLERCAPGQRTGIGKFFATPARRERYDYSHDGIMRSVEFSLERLGVDSIDVLFVHDIDIYNHRTAEVLDGHVKTLLASGCKALEKLRDQKVIKAFGPGVNEWQVAERLARAADFDIFLLAGRYTLLEQEALASFLPLCEARGIGIVLGGPFNSGILATGPKPGARYDYAPAPRAIRARVARIEAVCRRHGVKLADAALRFPMHHPQVVSVIPGGVTPREVARNVASLAARIPREVWRALKAEGLLHPAAPVTP